MPILSEILFIFIITLVGVSTRDECDDTKTLISKCYNHNEYQWLIKVPKSKTSCDGRPVGDPIPVTCNFDCSPGAAFDELTLGCKNCSAGKFSLGGGHQYTFSGGLEDLKSNAPELSLKVGSIFDFDDEECKKKEPWKIKGNILQADVQHNCAVSLSLRFELKRAGSISIAYNLPISYAVGSISSRCDFGIEDNDDESDPKKNFDVMLRPTGYGVWKTKEVKIDAAGEYTLVLYTIGVNAFHFPFAIRSIVVDGSTFPDDCTPCPPGTFASKEGSSTCTPCPKDTYAEGTGTTECLPCDASKYADEGSSSCTSRPICELKHYQKVFTGCDTSNMATVEYKPIQPKICKDGISPPEPKQSPCGTCNPGMYKENESGKCKFCPPKTYSNGTSDKCHPCPNDLSLLPGLYYKIWNELPADFDRLYMSFDEASSVGPSFDNQSWIPSIDYISSQALPDTLSLLSLKVIGGFRQTEIAKATKEYGTLYFRFSIQCQSSCKLFLVSQGLYASDADPDWEVIHTWPIDKQSEHKTVVNYTYSIPYPDEITFSWLFSSNDIDQGTDEIRIYEIRVTNTERGGSDQCIRCLTTNNQETECKSCAPGDILSNNTCSACRQSTIASRIRPNDPAPTICKPCTNNTVSDDGISCYVPCNQTFNGDIQYDLNTISTIEFHASKLFTQKGSGYYHVFRASICGRTNVTCAKTATSTESKRSANQVITGSKLCRMGSLPDKNDNVTSIAYIDEFGEELVNVSLSTSKYFPALRSDYNLTDITLVYRANTSDSQSTCLERITYLSLRCDHILDDGKQNSSIKYKLQAPNDCASGTCDGCVFYFLIRTPFACPICDENTNGFRTFIGPCKFGRQEVRKIPYPYCAHHLNEKIESRKCSILSTEIKIILALFVVIASILVSVVIACWRRNRKLEYRYMQLIENTNPDDDTPVDNVCAQISDEEESGDEVQFKKQSKAKKIMNVVRNAIRKNPNNGQSDFFSGDSFLLTSPSTNQA